MKKAVQTIWTKNNKQLSNKNFLKKVFLKKMNSTFAVLHQTYTHK